MCFPSRFEQCIYKTENFLNTYSDVKNSVLYIPLNLISLKRSEYKLRNMRTRKAQNLLALILLPLVLDKKVRNEHIHFVITTLLNP